MTRQVDENWVRIQQTTFTKWVNNSLRGGHLKSSTGAKTPIVGDLTTDLQDGLVLVQLIESVASPRKVGRYNARPIFKPQKLENLATVLRFLEREQIKLVNIGPEDIYSGNLKLILGLIWTLIRHFQIRSSGKDMSTKNALLQWVCTQIPDHQITNFTTDWNDGISLCALVDRIQPGLCPHHATLHSADALDNCQLGIDVAEEKLGIPKLLEAADLCSRNVDEKSVMTYISYFCKPAKQQLMKWIQSKIPDKKITNFTTDWNNGINLACLLNSIIPGIFSDCNALDPHNSLQNLVKAMKLAEEHLGVRPVVKPSQLADPKVDELNVVTYLTRFQYAKALPQPKEIVCSGHGIHKAFLGRMAYFQVDTSRAGSGELSVTITATGGIPVAANINAIEGHKGCYNINYIPNRAGKLTIGVNWSDHPITDSPFSVDILDLNSFSITGNQITGGQCAKVGKLVVMEVRGIADIADLYVIIQHSDGHTSTASIKSKGNEDLEIAYTPTCVGKDEAFVKIAGEDIPGSPFPVRVVDPSQCSLAPRDPTAGKPGIAQRKVTFTVSASKVNAYGLAVELKSPAGAQELTLEQERDGVNVGSFVPIITGNYSIFATCAGENIRGSPLSISVGDPVKCAILDTIPRYIQLKKPVVLNISTKGAGPGSLEVSSNQPAVLSTVLRKGDNEFYSLHLTPHTIGEATIGIKWNSENLANTPFGVFVCDASKCSAYGPGLTEGRGKVGELFKFTLQATQAGRGDLVVKPSGPKVDYAAEIKESQNGIYQVQFTTYENGPHSIEILWGGAPISNSPLKVVFVKGAVATQFTASGEGLKRAVAFQTAKFILLGPESGLVDNGTLKIKISGSGHESQMVEKALFNPNCGELVLCITDSGNGAYQIEYAVPTSGTYNLTILCDGDHIPNSPFSVHALPGPDASKCKAFGEAIENPYKIVVGKPLEFQVDSTLGGTGQLKVSATDSSSKSMPVYLAEEKTLKGERIHTIKVHLATQGIHKIAVLWGDVDIPGSPFLFEASNPKNVVVKDLSDAHSFIAEVGESFTFVIDPRKAGTGEIKAAYKLDDGMVHILDMKEQDDGTAVFTCTPHKSGTMELMLTYSGVNVLPVPWVCDVANLSLFQVNHPKEKYSKQGEYVKFVITGLTKKNISQMTFTAIHPEHKATVKVDYGKERTAVARFTAKQKGEYRCEVLCGRKHIEGSPFYVLVANPGGCKIIGTTPSLIPISHKRKFLVQTKDAGPGELSFSNETSGGEKSSSLKCDIRVKSTNPSLHQVDISGICCGKSNFFLKWAGYNIPSTPMEITVVDPLKCTFACAITEGPVRQGEEVAVTIDTTQGGNCTPTVIVKGPKADYNVDLSNGSDGHYLAQFTPWQDGDHTLEVFVGEAQIENSPFEFQVMKPVNPKKITVGGHGLQGAVVNKEADFTIFARESQLLDKGFLTFDVKKTSSSSLMGMGYPDIECKDNGNGTYNLSFVPKEPGYLQLAIKAEGQPILGSPFNIEVYPEPDAKKCFITGKVIDENGFAKIHEPVELTIDSTSAGTGNLTVSGVQPNNKPLRIFTTEEHHANQRLHILKFDPAMIGAHILSVRWDGEDVSGSPLSINVVNPSKCTLNAQLPTCLKIGESRSVLISTKDTGEGEVTVSTSSTSLRVLCEQKENFVTELDLTAVEFGEADIDVKFGGYSIPHMPFTISLCDPSKCVIDTLEFDASRVVVGVPFHFRVTTFEAGNAKLQVKPLSTDHQYTVEIKKIADETFNVTCTAWNVGEQSLDILFGNGTIPGSPIALSVTDPKKCSISGLPDPRNFIPIIGEPFSFTVDFSQAGPGDVCSKAISSSEASEDINMTVSDNVASFVYVPSLPGRLELTVEFNGSSILTSPWISDVPDPSRFRVTPPKGIGKLKEYVKFPITGLNEGTKSIEIKAIHPDHDASVKTESGKDEGTVIARFTPKKIGEYKVEVTHAGQHIDGSPFVVSIADPDACKVTIPSPQILHVGETGTMSMSTAAAGPGELTCQYEVISGNCLEPTIQQEDEESYTVQFSPTSVGKGQLTMMWAKYFIPNASFEVNFVDASLVTWSSQPDLTKGIITQGERICINIDAKEGGQAIPQVKSVGSESTFVIETKANNDGTFTAYVNTWQVGANTIEILWGDQPIANTPIIFNIAKAVDARSVTATGEGLKCAVIGQPADILINAPESGLVERGLLVVSCKPTVVSEDEEDNETHLPSFDITDNGDGRYTLSLFASHEGVYNLHITCDNQPIIASPFTVTVYAAANASKCKAYGNALDNRAMLALGDPVEFSVDTTDGGHGHLSVSIQQPNAQPSRVYSLEEKGTRQLHHLKFDPEVVGHYTADVMWEGVHVPGSPFNFNVTDASKCRVSGMPHTNSILNVNQGISFRVHAKNAGEDTPKVLVAQPNTASQVSLIPQHVSSTVWEYNFTTSALGTHATNIKFGGHHIPGSPYHYQVIDPSKFSITDLNLKGRYALVCELISFLVQGKAPEKEGLALIAHGPTADISIESQKQSNGSYICSFVPIEPGSYEVFVECAGNHVNGSPFTVLVADPSKCQILGNVRKMIQVGEPEEIVVKTRGAGAGEIEVYLNGGKENVHVQYKIENQGLDTYLITLTGTEVCQVNLDIYWAGYSIPQAQFSLTMLDANLCKAFGNALMTKKGTAGEQISFTVVTHHAGQGTLTVKAKGPSALYNLDIKEVKECTYEVNFTPWEIGEHYVDICWGPRHIPKSPFLINIENPMDRVTCSATGPGLKHAISGQPATFTVISSEIGLLDKNALKVSVIGVQSHAEVTIKDTNNGCYKVEYIAPTSGAYIASVAFYDRQITGSPFKINVVPGPDASKCRAYGPALHPNALHITGTPLELHVDSGDAGYGSLRLYVQGPNDYRPRIFMADDGKGIHTIKFDAMRAGKYFVVIAWAEKHIPGSPFKLRVHPAADASRVKMYGPGLKDSIIGDTGEFFIDTKLAGLGMLLVRVHGIKDSFKVEANPVAEDKPRLLIARYHPKIPGEYTIFVRWSGNHVPGSPFTVLVMSDDAESQTPFPISMEPSNLIAEGESPVVLTHLDDQEGAGYEKQVPAGHRLDESETTGKKKSQLKKDKESAKKSKKEKSKKKEKTHPPIGPVPTDLKMKPNPMGGFTMSQPINLRQLPPGTVVAPNGQLVVMSSSGHFLPLQMMTQPTTEVSHRQKVAKSERKAEKKLEPAAKSKRMEEKQELAARVEKRLEPVAKSERVEKKQELAAKSDRKVKKRQEIVVKSEKVQEPAVKSGRVEKRLKPVATSERVEKRLEPRAKSERMEKRLDTAVKSERKVEKKHEATTKADRKAEMKQGPSEREKKHQPPAEKKAEKKSHPVETTQQQEEGEEEAGSGDKVQSSSPPTQKETKSSASNVLSPIQQQLLLPLPQQHRKRRKKF